MFDKVLVANRGEIACRVISTARRMGLRTVAVYSSADQNARHTTLADEAKLIGPPPPTESYLAIDRIVGACRETGADAVHPGYGFLSENAAFARQLADEGIAFVGPSPAAIARLGDKITARELAAAAGVNIIPGSSEVVRDPGHAVALARELGYPVMLKASAGGGGKGLRVARDDAECRAGFQRATSEALSSFDDGRLFVEKYIENPRHIELQVLADHFGSVLQLGERECSLQRRHQKVIEEAPSPLLDEQTRAAMGAQAVALAKAVDYRSAGTVEFVVDADRKFYFLEMNTRLQVEHPVTELITGLDLVELMIRVAAGEPLPCSQQDIQSSGWAVEARVYAEDPARGFLPATGRLTRYLPPPESEQVRVDSGVREGSEISIYYDPLIAKVIVWGADRDAAIERLRNSLNEFCIQGLTHNIAFLTSLLGHPRVRAGQLTTDLIGDEYPEGFHPANAASDQLPMLIAVAASMHRRHMDRAAQIDGQLPGYPRSVDGHWVVVLRDEQFAVEVRSGHDGQHVTFDGATYQVSSGWRFGEPVFRGAVNGVEICVQVERHSLSYRLHHMGVQLDLMVLPPRAAESLAWLPAKQPADTSRFLLSPMPGLLSEIAVAAGDEIRAGQQLVVVEAMKMENVLRAECDGRVAQVLVNQGETVVLDQPLLEFQ